MRKHRFLALVALVGVGLALSASVAQADIILFSEVGYPVKIDPNDEFSRTMAPSALSFTTVPNIQMQVGEERTLSIWLKAEGSSHTYASMGWDVDSSNGSVVHLTGQTVVNAANVETGGLRWDGVINGAAGAPGSTDLLTNVRALSLLQGASVGRGSSSAAVNGDQGRDNATVAFYLGDITFRADAAGTTGLYFRNGAATNFLKSPSIGASIMFGTSTTVYSGDNIGAGDPITPDLLEADAIITVMGTGPTVGVTRTAHDGSDTSGDVVINGVGNTFRNANGASSGRINIVNFVGDSSGDLPLFFDLVEGANAQQLVDDLNAAAAGAFTAALSGFSAPNSDSGGLSTADIEIRYAGVPAGGSFFIDYDFGNVGVAAVGVPEPSSMALLGMSLIGLVGYGVRRRRLA